MIKGEKGIWKDGEYKISVMIGSTKYGNKERNNVNREK